MTLLKKGLLLFALTLAIVFAGSHSIANNIYADEQSDKLQSLAEEIDKYKTEIEKLQSLCQCGAK